ncbi:hypothetical protein Dsin_023643 [Dipteronia sinensis]|uniref:Uncharacterized protein n=1 Tax=Dipteronia sinensis TaxID=43782 RepID=A0AAE0E0Z1_9ROSI|nr:hypothetical protein Dsin_023643 [Dipteronia sinensis]
MHISVTCLDLNGARGSFSFFMKPIEVTGKTGRRWPLKFCNRSVEIVEALYSMNRAFLSLPEGTASVVGLTAMMTDHYNVMLRLDFGFEMATEVSMIMADQYYASLK